MRKLWEKGYTRTPEEKSRLLEYLSRHGVFLCWIVVVLLKGHLADLLLPRPEEYDNYYNWVTGVYPRISIYLRQAFQIMDCC